MNIKSLRWNSTFFITHDLLHVDISCGFLLSVDIDLCMTNNTKFKKDALFSELN